MKNKTKANLLKTRGIIKKACVWTPLIAAVAGLGLGLGFLIGGSVKADNAVKDFKKTPIYAEVYNQEYEKIKEEYDSGEITMIELNEKMEAINNKNYPRQVLEQAGDEAKEYKAELKTGITYEFASIAGWTLAFGGIFSLLPWFIGPELGWKLENSGDRDLYHANALLYKANEEKKKKEIEELVGEQNEDDEEALPNIEDSYYNE